MSDGSKRARRSPTDSVMRMTACTVRPYISSPLTCSVNSFSMDDSFRRLATFSTTCSQIPAGATVEPQLAPDPPLKRVINQFIEGDLIDPSIHQLTSH